MNEAIYARIRANPKFVQLVRRRGRLAAWLAGIVLVLFYALVLTVAFAPTVIGQRVMEGSTLSVGIAAGLFQFVFFWILTALYVVKANTEFDGLTSAVIEDAVQAEVAAARDAAVPPLFERAKEASGAAR